MCASKESRQRASWLATAVYEISMARPPPTGPGTAFRPVLFSTGALTGRLGRKTVAPVHS
eukprot:15477551-Alexandrium_andersonii.AAC.1